MTFENEQEPVRVDCDSAAVLTDVLTGDTTAGTITETAPDGGETEKEYIGRVDPQCIVNLVLRKEMEIKQHQGELEEARQLLREQMKTVISDLQGRVGLLTETGAIDALDVARRLFPAFTIVDPAATQPVVKRDPPSMPKYIDPANPKNVWYGRGKRPGWLLVALHDLSEEQQKEKLATYLNPEWKE